MTLEENTTPVTVATPAVVEAPKAKPVKAVKKSLEIDDIMSAARIDGDDDIYEMCTMAEVVRIEADELGDEWILHFRIDDDTYYAYIPLSTDLDEIVEFFVDQDIDRKYIRYPRD